MSLIKTIINTKDKTGRFEFVLKLKLFFWPVLKWLAFFWRRTFLQRLKIIVVIGSLGKTSTTKIISALVQNKIEKNTSTNRFGGIAWTLITTNPFKRFKVFEIGIDSPGTMARMGSIFLPDFIVFTSVGLDHAPDFDGIAHIREEKAQMLRYLRKGGKIFYNGDDENVRIEVQKSEKESLSFGFDSGNKIRCLEFNVDLNSGTKCKVEFNDKVYDIRTKLMGEKMIYPVLAGVVIGLELKMAVAEIRKKIENVKPAHGRLQTETLNNGALLVGDFFKATVDSVLPAFKLIQEHKAKRKILFFGDLGYLRENFEKIALEYGQKMGEVFTHAIFVGEMENAFFKGAIQAGMKKENVFLCQNNWQKGMGFLPKDLNKDDIIYVSGRVHQKMERVFLSIRGEEINCSIPLCKMYSFCNYCEKRNAATN